MYLTPLRCTALLGFLKISDIGSQAGSPQYRVHPLVLFLKLSFIYFCIHFLVVLPSTCLLVVIVNEVRVPGSRCCRVWLVVEREPARR